MVADADPQPIAWAERVDALRGLAAAQPDRAVSRAAWLDGDELDAGPTLEAALEARWSWVCPERFVNARLGDVAVPHRERLEQYVRRPDGRTLAISGDVGCGKTHAAMAVARALHERSREVRFFPVVELWRKLRPGGEDDLIDAVVDVDVLVLDDLGSERATEWSAEQLWEIVNRRWLDKRSTIITSNHTWTDLRDAIGVRVYDRLVNAETVRMILDGGSRRRG